MRRIGAGFATTIAQGVARERAYWWGIGAQVRHHALTAIAGFFR